MSNETTLILIQKFKGWYTLEAHPDNFPVPDWCIIAHYRPTNCSVMKAWRQWIASEAFTKTWNSGFKAYELTPEDIRVFGVHCLENGGEWYHQDDQIDLSRGVPSQSIAVAGLIVHPDDRMKFSRNWPRECRVLVSMRGGNASDEYYKWEFPGGKVEGAESLEHALRREIKKEVGLELGRVMTCEAYSPILVQYQNDSGAWLCVCSWCSSTSPNFDIGDRTKVLDAMWIELGACIEKLENFSGPCQQIIQEIGARM